MKKKWLIISIVALIIVVATIVVFLIFKNQSKIFSLESKYYNTGEKIEINTSELEELISDKESFVVFVSQDMCLASSNFEVVINDFLEEYPITIYEINYSELKESDLGDFLEHYPSFVIYKNGKMVDFLDANADEDIDYYKTKEGFKNWFTQYVNLAEVNKDNSLSNNNTNIDKEDAENENSAENDNDVEVTEESNTINLDYITKEEGKVNIYFFWGDGCPHCESEFAFFDSIESEYGDYYNLYTFETWKNEKNAELLKTFSDAMEVESRGVPYTIIGEEVFTGFSESMESDFINAIVEEKDKSFDVYFDKISFSN